jgi:hypothetical protein
MSSRRSQASRKSAWNQFRRSNKGSGKSLRQLSTEYRRRRSKPGGRVYAPLIIVPTSSSSASSSSSRRRSSDFQRFRDKYIRICRDAHGNKPCPYVDLEKSISDTYTKVFARLSAKQRAKFWVGFTETQVRDFMGPRSKVKCYSEHYCEYTPSSHTPSSHTPTTSKPTRTPRL